MKRAIIVALVLAAAGLVVVQVATEEEEEADASQQELPLEAVPQHVLAAARAAVEGVELTEAEVEAVLVYELEGVVNGREVEIEVTDEGHVIEVEDEDDDDDEEERRGR